MWPAVIKKGDHQNPTTDLARSFALVLLFHRSSVEAQYENSGFHFLGDEVRIICGIEETCSWPEWRKELKRSRSMLIVQEGTPFIHPDYADRWSYDTDNKTLIVKNLEQSDQGIYKCACSGHDDSPQTFVVNLQEPFDACVIKIISNTFVLLLIVVIIIQCYFLIRTYQECKQNEDKLKKKIKSVVHTVFSVLILVIAVFIIVSVCFKAILTIEEDCEKLTKMKHCFYVFLLVVEIIVFVLGAINGLVYNYFVRKRKNAPGYKAQYAKRTFDNHMTGGDTGSIKDNAEVPNTEQLLKELEKEGSVND